METNKYESNNAVFSFEQKEASSYLLGEEEREEEEEEEEDDDDDDECESRSWRRSKRIHL